MLNYTHRRGMIRDMQHFIGIGLGKEEWGGGREWLNRVTTPIIIKGIESR